MISIYRYEDGFYTIEFFQCAAPPVDHLHFEFKIHVGQFFKEEIEGWVSFDDTEDTLTSLAEKVNKLYIDKMVTISQQMVRNGEAFIH